jgi:hypothetical protein
MNWLIFPLIVVAALGVPTMLGIIPVFLGVPAMLAAVIIMGILLIVLSRGLPMAIMWARMRGGMLWAVVKKTGEIVVDRFEPYAGWVFTKRHGEFAVMPSRIYKMAGVPTGFAPEDAAYNLGLDHIQLVNELKRRGINDIREIVDVNQYGQVTGFKDDPRIRDLKLKFKSRPTQIDLSGFNDFYRYCAEATNPYIQEAKTKIKVAQGIIGEKGKWNWLIYVGVMVMLVAIGLVVLFLFTKGGAGGGGGQVIPA